MKFREAAKIFWDYLSIQSKVKSQLDVVQFLRKLPLFEGLSERELARLNEVLYHRSYQTGESLFEYDQPGAALFIIQSGEISIEIPSGENRFTQVAVLPSGSFLGELALLDDSPRSASARALKQTECFSLFRADLHKLVETDPEIATRIYKALATIVGERLKATNELVNNQDENSPQKVA